MALMFPRYVLLTLVALSGCTSAPDPDAVAASVVVVAVADEYLAGLAAYSPEFATSVGLPGANHAALTDNSLAALDAWSAREDGWLARLAPVDTGALAGRAEAGTYAVLREQLEGSVAARVCRDELWGVASYVNGWQSFYTDLARLQPVATDSLRGAALARLRALPGFLDTEIGNLREGLRLGYSSPKVIVRAVIAQLDDLLATSPRRSPFASPSERDSTPAFRAAYVGFIGDSLHPAIRRYRDFLATEYLSRAREALGVAANPDGAACYRAKVRQFSTVDISPEEVHRTGLAEMARIEDEMRRISARSFNGLEPGALLEQLKTDRRYTFRTGAEIIAFAQAAVDRSAAAMPRAFGLATDAKVVIEPYPEFRARAGAPGQYNQGSEDGSRPGIYLINAYDPEHTSRATIENTTFHEAYPGHHWQISIARERPGLHRVSQYFGSTGFVEGWGLYAEGVANDLDLYSDDVSRMGWLASRAFRAARLVLDAGIHSKGMSRDSAVAYLRAHSTRSPAEVEGEINRYISWPGQATAYMLGNLEMLRLREEARGALGDRFDLRAFHDRLLEDGNVPIPFLRAKIERWLADER